MDMDKILKTINEKLDNYFSPNGKKIFLVIVALAIVAMAIYLITFVGNGNKTASDDADNLPKIEDINTRVEEEQAEMARNEITVEDDMENEKMVSLTVDDFGRADPFMPSGENFSKSGFELMAPPDTISEGTPATKIVTTKISGIMYDSKRPSAILNIEGSDYLVRSGDHINNYKILSIGKDTVTVQLGSNVYKTRVGEYVTDGEMNYNTVYKLENKFGGARKQ